MPLSDETHPAVEAISAHVQALAKARNRLLETACVHAILHGCGVADPDDGVPHWDPRIPPGEIFVIREEWMLDQLLLERDEKLRQS